MANRSYLCCTDYESIYPSAVLPGYSPAISTIASDVYCVPLLWPALFRAEDFTVQAFESDEGEFEACAPVAEKQRALANLAEARKWYADAFSELGALDEHFDLFERAVREAPGQYVTIELEEIAVLYDTEDAEGEFYERFEAVLAALDEPPDEDAATELLGLATYREARPFPSARLALDNSSEHEDDHWNHCRIFGAGVTVGGIGRPVPWEPKPTT